MANASTTLLDFTRCVWWNSCGLTDDHIALCYSEAIVQGGTTSMLGKRTRLSLAQFLALQGAAVSEVLLSKYGQHLTLWSTHCSLTYRSACRCSMKIF